MMKLYLKLTLTVCNKKEEICISLFGSNRVFYNFPLLNRESTDKSTAGLPNIEFKNQNFE